MKPALIVKQAAIGVTLQNEGRWGFQHYGLPVSGALDKVALAAANALVGNSAGEAGLEIPSGGLELEVAAEEVHLAVCGMVQSCELTSPHGRKAIPAYRSFLARRGEVIRLGPPFGGAVYYLAVEGGFDAQVALGSKSTYVRAGLGGFGGRALEKGDVLPLTRGTCGGRPGASLHCRLKAPASLRIMRGPNGEFFTNDTFSVLFSRPFTVAIASDRMGLRLGGPKLSRASTRELLPQGTVAGALQVPPGGAPILLLADRQTTGGYPCIATVIGADVPAAGRLAPGMEVRFEEVGRQEAVAALKALRDFVESLPGQVRFAPENPFSSEDLLEKNLIDGVIDGKEASK